MIFQEDNKEFLQKAIPIIDKIIDENPDMIIEPDPELEKEIDDLVKGVEID